MVCDADAIVPPDLLTRTLPLFGQTPAPADGQSAPFRCAKP